MLLKCFDVNNSSFYSKYGNSMKSINLLILR